MEWVGRLRKDKAIGWLSVVASSAFLSCLQKSIWPVRDIPREILEQPILTDAEHGKIDCSSEIAVVDYYTDWQLLLRHGAWVVGLSCVCDLVCVCVYVCQCLSCQYQHQSRYGWSFVWRSGRMIYGTVVRAINLTRFTLLLAKPHVQLWLRTHQ